MSTTHSLKTWPGPFAALRVGLKTFEVRRDDRGFSEGDTLRLKEWWPTDGVFSGRVLTFTVGYIARGPDWGLPADMVVMSLLADDGEGCQ